uniref:GATA zinc finger domain-containing protein 14-like n=1 Tax=Pristiophorus japonicus TaxID=55135 RepID=UPI00398F1B7C
MDREWQTSNDHMDKRQQFIINNDTDNNRDFINSVNNGSNFNNSFDNDHNFNNSTNININFNNRANNNNNFNSQNNRPCIWSTSIFNKSIIYHCINYIINFNNRRRNLWRHPRNFVNNGTDNNLDFNSSIINNDIDNNHDFINSVNNGSNFNNSFDNDHNFNNSTNININFNNRANNNNNNFNSQNNRPCIWSTSIFNKSIIYHCINYIINFDNRRRNLWRHHRNVNNGSNFNNSFDNDHNFNNRQNNRSCIWSTTICNKSIKYVINFDNRRRNLWRHHRNIINNDTDNNRDFINSFNTIFSSVNNGSNFNNSFDNDHNFNNSTNINFNNRYIINAIRAVNNNNFNSQNNRPCIWSTTIFNKSIIYHCINYIINSDNRRRNLWRHHRNVNNGSNFNNSFNNDHNFNNSTNININFNNRAVNNNNNNFNSQNNRSCIWSTTIFNKSIIYHCFINNGTDNNLDFNSSVNNGSNFNNSIDNDHNFNNSFINNGTDNNLDINSRIELYNEWSYYSDWRWSQSEGRQLCDSNINVPLQKQSGNSLQSKCCTHMS